MGTVSKTITENMTWNNYKSTWVVNITLPDITVTGSTFSLQPPSGSAKFTYSGKDRAFTAISATAQCNNQNLAQCWVGRPLSTPNWHGEITIPQTSSGVFYPLGGTIWKYLIPEHEYDDAEPYEGNHDTATFFNSSNKTIRSLPVGLLTQANFGQVIMQSYKNSDQSGTANQYMNINPSTGVRFAYDWGTIASVTLDVPPTATISPLSVSGPQYFTGLTTITVDIDDLTAYYGGDFTTTTAYPAGVKFEIGSQSDERQNDGTLSFALQNAGTFTPKVTVTDSRGQTLVQEFNPITVQSYNPSTSIQSVSRINPSTGKADDEGTNAVVACVFDYPIIASNYMKRPVVKIDGQSPTNTVNWYTSWTENGGFSGQVSFSNYNPTRPVTLYGKITDTLAKGSSYEISVICDTTLGPGSAYYKTLPQSFYLLSGAAGGHGLGIGMKVPPSANGEGLHVGMEEVYHKTGGQLDTDKVWSANNGQEDVAALYWNGLFKARPAPGIIKMYAGSSAPDGWLLCDGSAVSRTDYSLLYAVIGTTYGSGDGSTTFNIPDLRGRFPVGAGVNYNVGSTGGSEDSIIPYHNHHVEAISSGAQWATLTGAARALGWSTATAAGIISISNVTNDRTASSGKNFGHRSYNIDASHAHTVAAHDTNYAGTSGEEVGGNMPPYVGVNYIISTGEPSEWSGDSSDTIVRGVLVDGQSVVNGQGIAEVCETETNGIWTYRKWPNGKLEAWGTKTGTLSNYSTWNNMNGYYFSAVPTPITMIDQNYKVFGDWMIGSGFAWHATTLNKSTTSFNIYALSSSTGSQSCYVDMYLYGRWK